MSNEELVISYQNGNQDALVELIENNKGLIHYHAKRYNSLCTTALDIEDLIQEGYIGLMAAARNFNPDMDILFSTYSSKVIISRILRTITQNIPREKKSDINSDFIVINSIHDFIPGSDKATWEDIIPLEKKIFQDVERDIDNKILNRDLRQLLDNVFGEEFIVDPWNIPDIQNIKAYQERLNQRITAKEVLLLHYGILGKIMTFSQISDCVDLSIERLSFIEQRALEEIRNSEYIISFIEKYGYEFKISIESWDEARVLKSSPEAMSEKIEEKISSIDDLLKACI